MYVNKALNYSGFVNTCVGCFFCFFLNKGNKKQLAKLISFQQQFATTNRCKCRKSGGGNGMEKTEGGDITAKAQGCWPIRSQKMSKLG